MKSITKPRNVIQTVVVLDPATNHSISRIQKSPFIQDEVKEEENVTEVVEETTPTEEEVITPVEPDVPTEPEVQEPDTPPVEPEEPTDPHAPVDEEIIIVEDEDERFLNLPAATDEDIQAIIDGYGHEDVDSNNISSNSTEFDDSNIPVATDEDIQAIIDGYRRRF